MNGGRLLARIAKTAALAAMAAPVALSGQNAPEASEAPESREAPRPPEVVRASLMVCSPGSAVYELEGHAALRLTFADGSDLAVNYGMFDFDAPNFIYRFVSGQTDYHVGAYPMVHFLGQYRREGRRVVEYPLRLSAPERERLLELVATNLLPENRIYRYNYVKDNCSTRPLRLIEMAVGDTLTLAAPAATAGWTFRDAMRSYHRNYPWYQFGIDLALGSGIDYPVSEHEKAFAPVLLGEMLPGATVGRCRRLVGAPTVLVEQGDGAPAGPTPWPLTPMAAALATLAAALAVALADVRRRRLSRWADAAYMGVAGVAGCLVAFLVVVSSHEATAPNWLLVWLNPACLVAAVGCFIKRWAGLLFCYEIVNFVALFLLCMLWPLTGQTANPAFWPLIAADMVLGARHIYINATCARKQTRA